MNVTYDYQAFAMQKYGGISRYFCELLDQFSKVDTINCSIILKYSENYYINSAYKSKYKRFLPGYKFKGKNSLVALINKQMSINKIKEQKYDIFHPTYYNSYFLKYLGNKPFVLTVHDMIHELYPIYFSKYDKTIARKKLLIEKASKLIAISERTKQDIIKLYNTPPEKIEVIYHSSSLNRFAMNSEEINSLPNRYILFVGSRVGYKNFGFFVEAIYKLLLEDKDLNIICAGGGNFSVKELEMFNRFKIRSKMHQFNVDDDVLVMLYRRAILFAFPSLYEGFGIPILESFNCGCPVALSNSSSFPEVAGNAAIYFDPCDMKSIKSSIEKLTYDKELQKELRFKGSIQAKRFSWDLTAHKTNALYESIL